MVNVAALKARVLAVNMATHGVAATVTTRHAETSIPTRGIWLSSLLDESGPVGGDFRKRRTRQLMALPRSAAAAAVLTAAGLAVAAVPAIERDDIVTAAPMTGGAAVEWRVDEIDTADADHWRVILTR